MSTKSPEQQITHKDEINSLKGHAYDSKRPRFVLKLQELRETRGDVDALKMIEHFPEAVRARIFQGLQHIQYTDGCTGGCPWCSFDVRRKITAGFSFESIVSLFEQYGHFFPDIICLYWASDPLDIAGKRKSGEIYNYPGLVATLLDTLRPTQRIYTSTVIPEGTYESAKELMFILHNHWLTHDLYAAENNLLHAVRFSVTDKNAEIISTLKQELLEMGLYPGFVQAQFSAAETRGKNDVKKLGQFINHPERNPLSNDVNTVACYDGTLLRPDGIFRITMEAATKESPFGYALSPVMVLNGEIALPQYCRINDFQESVVAHLLIQGGLAHMLPNVRVNYYDEKTGDLIRSVDEPNLRRDLLAYTYAFYALGLIPSGEKNDKQRKALDVYEEELDARWHQTLSLVEKSTDEEAKRVVGDWYRSAKGQAQRLRK